MKNRINILLKLIILLIILIIVIAVTLLFLKKINTFGNNNYIEENVYTESVTELTLLNNIYDYYNGIHYINVFLASINENNNYLDLADNIDNINELKGSKFYPQKAYYKEFNDVHSIYLYQGKLKKGDIITDKCVGLIIDYENMSWKIIIGNSIEEINTKKIDYNVDLNDTNAFSYYYAKDEEIIRNIYNNFKFNFKFDSNYIYNNLMEEYKQKRFDNNIHNFNIYAQELQDKLQNGVLMGYEIQNISENETKYVIEDNNKNQYVFIQDENLDYKIMLDTYTVLDNDYRKKYYALENKEKAYTNIDMFIKMINTKDYQHAYEKLDETFKNNNFGSIESFKQYINNNFYDNNFMNIEEIEKKDDIYILKVNIANNVSSAAEKQEKQFIVKLTEGTDFVMSFNL